MRHGGAEVLGRLARVDDVDASEYVYPTFTQTPAKDAGIFLGMSFTSTA